MKSIFLSNLHYFYAQTDGTYKFPNSAEGDLLKRAKKEIEDLENENSKLSQYVRAYSVDPSRISNSEIAMARISLDERVVLEKENYKMKSLLSEIKDWMMDNDYECGPVGSKLYEDISNILNAK